MVGLVVNFERNRLPSRDSWEATLRQKSIDLTFPAEFDPHVHKEGPVTVILDGVCCRFDFALSGRPPAVDLPGDEELALPEEGGCNCSAAFRWDEACLPDDAAALSAAAGLALITDGKVAWSGTKTGYTQGANAFRTIRNQVTRRIKSGKTAAGFEDRRWGDAAEAAVYADGWLQCPRCGRRFSMGDEVAWDGEKHRGCGQKLTPVGSPQRATTSNSPADPGRGRRWRWPWQRP